MENKLPQLLFSYEENLSYGCFEEFISSIEKDKLKLVVEPRPPMEAMTSIKWLMPTAAVFFVAGSYFDGFLKEMGKDHYNLLKDSSSSLWEQFLAPEKKPNTTFLGTPGKLKENDVYSSLFSIMSELDRTHKIKFLFKDTYSKEEFSKAFAAYIEFLHELSKGVIDSSVLEQINKIQNLGATILISYDEGTGSLVVVDPVPKEIREKQRNITMQ